MDKPSLVAFVYLGGSLGLEFQENPLKDSRNFFYEKLHIDFGYLTLGSFVHPCGR